MRPALWVLCVLPLLVLTGCPGPEPEEETSLPPTTVDETERARPGVPEPEGGIMWVRTLEEGLEEAKQAGKPVLVDFYATWCGPCKLMDQETWPKPEVIKAAGDFVMVKLDVDEEQAAARLYDVDSVPTIVFMDSTGNVKHRQVGAVPVDEMVGLMEDNR